MPFGDHFYRDVLWHRTQGDLATIVAVAQAVSADGPARLTSLREALSSRDTEIAAREAHTLKGTFRSIGAPAAADLAEIVESAIRAGAFEAAEAARTRLAAEIEIVVSELSIWASTLVPRQV
jgi:two-component system, sensor histidine kinase and response regulator